jgi:hypothetical protein
VPKRQSAFKANAPVAEPARLLVARLDARILAPL